MVCDNFPTNERNLFHIVLSSARCFLVVLALHEDLLSAHVAWVDATPVEEALHEVLAVGVVQRRLEAEDLHARNFSRLRRKSINNHFLLRY